MALFARLLTTVTQMPGMTSSGRCWSQPADSGHPELDGYRIFADIRSGIEI